MFKIAGFSFKMADFVFKNFGLYNRIVQVHLQMERKDIRTIWSEFHQKRPIENEISPCSARTYLNS